MDEKSKHILIFTTAYRPFIGGSEMAIEEIAKRLPDFNFDIITPRYTHKLNREENLDNTRIFRVGWGWLNDKFLFPLVGFLTARNLLRERDYQIIHAYQASHGAGAAWLLKLFNPRLKFILTLQEGKSLDQQGFWINFFRKRIIKKADLITAISNYLKDYARKINKRVKIVLIPNGVDIGNFSKEYSYGELSLAVDSLGIKPGEKTIISASRLVPKNGVDILIRALAILNSQPQTIRCKLVLAGEGEQKNELIALARELNILDDVIFAGAITHGDLPKYLKISNVFVRPSRSEGLGSAFLEAMAAGVPVIGTKVGGIPDFLKDGETGLFCKADDPEDLTRKINLLLSDKELTAKITKNARSLVSEKYSWDLISKKFAEIYDANQV